MELEPAVRQLPFEYAVRNLGRSPLRLIVSVGSAALVVLLVLAAGSFVRGLQASLVGSGALAENVILLGAGSEESIERSQLDAGTGRIVAASVPGIETTLGVPHVSPEIHLALPLRPDRDSEEEWRVVVRGVESAAFLVHPEVEIVEGRAPRAGRDEIMVGALAAASMGVDDQRLAIGRTLHFDHRDWTIVGRFSAPNTVMDAEVWMPLRDLQIAARRDSISCVFVTLGDAAFADVDAFAKSRLDLELVAIPEAEYYAALANFFRPVQAMVWATAGLISIGGLFGGLNTMYAAFAARVRELGMLQALGYRRGAIVASLVEESIVAAAAGAVLACAAGMFLLEGVAVRLSMGAFALVVDAPVVLSALAAGLGVGVVGALPPAWRCLRLPIPEALKAH